MSVLACSRERGAATRSHRLLRPLRVLDIPRGIETIDDRTSMVQRVFGWVALVASGCVSQYELRDDGYYNLVVGYRVRNAGDDTAFVGPDWRLDNYSTRGSPTLKTGAEYETSVAVDTDDDGDLDHSFEMPLYDLRLVNRRTGATVWVRTVPLSSHDGERELDGLVRDYIDEVSGAGVTTVQFMRERPVGITRRFATETRDGRNLRVDGRYAYGATFDVASVDQVAVESDRRLDRVRIVLVRTERRYLPRGWRGGLPAFLLFGCASRPEDFDDAAGALRALVRGTDFFARDDGDGEEPPRIETTWPWDAPSMSAPQQPLEPPPAALPSSPPPDVPPADVPPADSPPPVEQPSSETIDALGEPASERE